MADSVKMPRWRHEGFSYFLATSPLVSLTHPPNLIDFGLGYCHPL